ncbi:Carbonic anhydrase, alpha-class [Trema orientale]|uniref:Carbonic anhydrase n=1 Tax=Trema orientale TaxID=63057 RepID=A0A2P5EC11_TREOI|nr:Carbonic anhydrase, alpha-class [Trema orientale]
MISRVFFSTLVLTLFIFGASSSEHDGPAFTYSGTTGPGQWGSLSPSYSTCSAGKRQSPVNIEKDNVVHNKKFKPLTRNYLPANSTLVNNGFNIGVHFEENAGVLDVDGKNYTLKQMHWHTPSEHRLDGVQFPAELHLVHKAEDDSLSVVAVLFNYSDRQDPLLSKAMRRLMSLLEP